MNELKERIHETASTTFSAETTTSPTGKFRSATVPLDTTDECGRRILRSTVLLCMRDI